MLMWGYLHSVCPTLRLRLMWGYLHSVRPTSRLRLMWGYLHSVRFASPRLLKEIYHIIANS